MNSYDTFYQLHHQQSPLIIGNAWNVKSAQLIEQNGFGAIATSSGAISASLGYDDGEKMPFAELLYIVKRICLCTTIPVSVDIERGYTNNLVELTNHVQQLIDAGVAGINIEDAQGDDVYLNKLEAISNYLAKTSQKLFVNARTDGFLQKLPTPLELTIKRAKRYMEAGANGLFVTGISDAEIIREIASSTTLPLNVVASPKLASFKALSACGVKRISMAVLLFKATYHQLDKLAKEVNVQQSLQPLF